MFRLCLLLPLTLVSACAVSPETHGDSTIATKSVNFSELEKVIQNKDDKTAIASDVMFMLLSAELAGQRGQYDVAFDAYIEAAKRANDSRIAERAAAIATYLKDSKKTQEAVSLWLNNDKGNLKARKIAALSALKNNDNKAVDQHLEALLKDDLANFDTVVIEIATVLQKEGKVDPLYDALEALSLKHSNIAGIYFVKSLLATQMKKNDLAKQQIEKALKIQPDWDKALIFQAQIAVLSNDMSTAKNALKEAIRKYPKNNKIKKLLAQVLIKAEDYKEAIKLYKQFLIAEPNDAESQYTLGLLYLQLDDYKQAKAQFTKLEKLPDWQNQANLYLGKIEEQKGNNKNALLLFDKAAQGDFVFDASLAAINLLAQNKQYTEAGSRLNSLQTLFPKQKQRLVIIEAELYNQQKQYLKAFDLLTEELKSDPEQMDLLYTRALIAERINKPEVLEADLKKILAKNPDNYQSLNALGYTLLNYPERLSEAETYLKRALKLQPEGTVIIDSYGWLQFKLGNTQQALTYLEKAYAKQPETEIAAHLSEVLWVLGRKKEAQKVFNKAFKNAPDDEYLLEFQQRILNSNK